LDWLAIQLIDGGWRLKPIHKLIMTSNVYRQTSAYDASDAAVDPQNRLYWRYDMRRLEAEVVRDSLLAVGGLLDRRKFGPGSLEESMRRRSIYFTVKRSKMIPCMQLLDMPESLVSIGERASTTIAPQALMFINGTQVRDCAEALSARLRPRADECLTDAIREAYQITLSRFPTEIELAQWLEFLAHDMADYESAGRDDARQLALANFCQMLLSLNEFLYVD
jgi:hypothetical protein